MIPDNCECCSLEIGDGADCKRSRYDDEKQEVAPGSQCPFVLLAAKERECEGLRDLCETLTISGCPQCGAEIGCNIDCVLCLQYHELVLARAALAEGGGE